MISSYFQIKEHQSTIKREVLAGITTFSTMAYVVIVVPQVLQVAGMDFGGVMGATILCASFSSILMGLLANYPFAIAPGMGLNAYFAYSVVVSQGHSWEIALGLSFLAGLLFLLLTLTGFRKALIHAIPSNLRSATAGGIGLFLAFIGMANVKLVVPHQETLVTLGNVTSPEILLTLFGLIVITALMVRGFPFALLAAILLNWLIGLTFGLVEWHGIFDWPPSIAPVFLKLDLWGALDWALLPIILSFVLVALFDAAGTLMSLAHHGGFLDPAGRLPRANRALSSDATSMIIAAVLGTSTPTTYLESASGIAAGGRTGLAAVVVGFLFLGTLFLVPMVKSIPLFATSPALIALGALMMTQIKTIDWNDPTETLPSFLVLIGIPLTFSVSTGIALGFVCYPLIKFFVGRGKEVHPLVWLTALLFSMKFILES